MGTDAVNLMEMSSPAVAFDIGVAECFGPTYSVPKRVRRRLEQSPETKSPASLEDIEAKLKEADYRRQQFHEWLVNKARPKRKLDQVSSPLSKDLAERLEARLYAAEQKRLEMLAQEQMRLARLHESRLAAKTEAQLRAEREREELGSKVEFRVQQAETNRMALVEAEKQRRAAANERIAQSIMQRTSLEDKDRERTEALRVAICQKIAAAEEKRACLLEAEKCRAQAIVLQARKVAEAVLRERELELNNKKEKLEARLNRAKRQRAEYLRQRGGCRGTCHNHGHKMHKHGDRLCRKLTRCWRQFRRSRKTTYSLAQEFVTSGINQRSVTSLPFEQLASRITSPVALRSAKEFLARIESRLMLSGDTSEIAKIDSLLKRVSPHKPTSKRGSTKVKDAPKNKDEHLERYPARVFLCAYMILGHPDAVFSTRGEREVALAEAATKLLPEFEALVSAVIDGPSPPGENAFVEGHKPFAAQLVSFDTAWHSYLCRFVAWKVKDAQLLEEDLIRVACQMEVSMLQKCRLAPGQDLSELKHDAQAIHKQVLEDQRLLRERIVHLTGKAGLGRMEEALAAVRSKFEEANVSLSPFAYSSPEDLQTPVGDPSETKDERPKSKVARSLFNSPSEADKAEIVNMDPAADIQNSGFTNEQIVNEMLHDGNWKLADDGNMTELHEQIRTTIERAFWDSIEEKLLAETPDYGQVVKIVENIRDELESIAPNWKQGLRESLDLELLSQVLESGLNDFNYLRGLLDYTLDVILKLGAPARDVESKSAQKTLIDDLLAATTNSATKQSFAKAVVKGIRFVYERLQVLKKDIYNLQLQTLAQLINSSAGIEHVQKSFAKRYNLQPSTQKSEMLEKIPQTVKWIRDVRATMEMEKAEIESALSGLQPLDASAPAFPMCTGGRSGAASSSSRPKVSGEEEAQMGLIKWGTTEALVRLGVLHIVCGPDAASENNLPETLTLNVSRIRDCQDDYQTTIVIAMSLLLLGQELRGKLPVAKLESILTQAFKDLSLLLSEPTCSIVQIGSFLAQVCAKNCTDNYPDVEACAKYMRGVLEKSLAMGNPVFERVRATIRTSLRSVLLVGSGRDGVSLAEAGLKRIGGGVCMESVVNLARKIDKICTVTSQVHGVWYGRVVSVA